MTKISDPDHFMPLFYISDVIGDTCQLGEEETRHCTRVLRLKPGDKIELTNGRGYFYQGKLIKPQNQNYLVEILAVNPVLPDHQWRLHIAMAPPKNIDRFEWFLEKATEIGIDEITPLICDHSERNTIKMNRLEKILISGIKQSLKAWLPLLHEHRSFRNLVGQEFKGQQFIAWCETGIESELQIRYQKGTDVLILIGPEGDFSDQEIETARASGFEPVSLGTSRLRTETAGIVACHAINLLNRLK